MTGTLNKFIQEHQKADEDCNERLTDLQRRCF